MLMEMKLAEIELKGQLVMNSTKRVMPSGWPHDKDEPDLENCIRAKLSEEGAD